MIQNEVTEIKKIMTKNDCCIHGLAGCYVDANKEMHVLEQGKFLVLQEEEQHKVFPNHHKYSKYPTIAYPLSVLILYDVPERFFPNGL